MHPEEIDCDSIKLISLYEQSVDLVRAGVEGLSALELKKRPIEGKWSCLELVCHLADTDIYFTDRIERTIALAKPLLMGVDERPYAERLQFQEQDLDEELELMALLRRRTARILRRQPEETWMRTAVHSEIGLCTLRDLVVKSIRHVQHHLPFLKEKRAALIASRVTTRVSHPIEYKAMISWENLGPDFCSGRYSRVHQWTLDGGTVLDASPSPHVVPSPWSKEDAIDPEEALVASAASCHMLTFLWLASKQGLIVHRYEDRAAGVMTKNSNGEPWVSQITLRPRIDWGSECAPGSSRDCKSTRSGS